MPCQVKPIKSILQRHQIKHFIISLCCSGQTTVEGTWLYYKLLGIRKDDVLQMQYRGNGWPSGIKITLQDKKTIFRSNWTYPWTLIHSSLLFRPKRCLFCTYKTVSNSDVNLADPWLKEYEEHDTIGNSLIICNSPQSVDVIKKMKCNNEISCIEVDKETYYLSQKGTIEAKEHIGNEIRYYNLIAKLMSNKIYRLFATYNIQTLKLHLKVINKIHKLCS